MSLQELLEKTMDSNASDLHLCAGYRPKLRIDGVLTDLEAEPLTEEDMLGFIAEVLPASKASTWAEDPLASAQFNCVGPRGSRFRTVAHKHVGGSAISMRLWPSSVPTPERIGLPQAVIDRVGAACRGLVMVSGPTGSGKSTTMYSLVDHINAHRPEHIVWISEPAEFILEPKQSMIRNIEVGTHMRSFSEAARAALRIDPDVVVMAELRDLESIGLALALAETGHLVFTTIHCPTTAEAVARMVEVYPVEQQPFIARQLGAVLECVIAQRLLPRASGKGRVAAYEVMFGTPAIGSLIAERRFGGLEAQIAEGAEGTQSMRQHLDRLVAENIVKEEDAKP
jgi:twitching motility protein PilT